MIKVGIANYLRENDLSESLIISLVYRPEQKEYIIVLDYAWTPSLLTCLRTGILPMEPSTRDFRLLKFKSVSSTSVSKIQIKEKCDLCSYYLKDRAPVTLHEAWLDKMNRYKVKIDFGTHGRVTFVSNELWVKRKLGYGSKVGDGWVYYDVESGEQFDFYNPFGEL